MHIYLIARNIIFASYLIIASYMFMLVASIHYLIMSYLIHAYLSNYSHSCILDLIAILLFQLLLL
jgi:hypothetical protein